MLQEKIKEKKIENYCKRYNFNMRSVPTEKRSKNIDGVFHTDFTHLKKKEQDIRQ